MASSCWGYQYVTSLVVSLPTSTWEQQIMVPFFHCGLVLKNILGLNHLKQKWLIWPNLSVEKLCFGSKLVMTKSPLFYLVGPRLMGTCTTCMALHTKYQTHMGAYNHFLATYVPILKKSLKFCTFQMMFFYITDMIFPLKTPILLFKMVHSHQVSANLVFKQNG